FTCLSPSEGVPEAWVIATFVASSALVGALCVSAPAVLSRNAHSAFTAGWVVAALTTVLCLLLPLPFLERTMLALLIGPAAGVLLHGIYLAVARNGESTSVSPD